MLVCLCYGVSDRQIRKLVSEGACTREMVQACSRVGTGCGACIAQVEHLVQEASATPRVDEGVVHTDKSLKSAG